MEKFGVMLPCALLSSFMFSTALGADIAQVSAEQSGRGKQEILQNGGFEETTLVKKEIVKWAIAGKRLPAFWSPVHTYDEGAKLEIAAKAADPADHELRLTRGALEQRLAIKPSAAERIMDISFDCRGPDGLILVRVNGKDCIHVAHPTEEMRHYRGHAIIKPGESVTRLSIWNSRGDLYIDNLSAKLEEAQPAAEPRVMKVAVPTDTGTAETWLTVGANGLELAAHCLDGSSTAITLHPFSLIIPSSEEDKRTTLITSVLADAGIEIAGISTGRRENLRRYVRPNVNLLKDAARKATVAGWGTLPSARGYRFPLTFRLNGERLDCLVDHQYAGTIAANGGLKEIVFSCPEGSTAEKTVCAPVSSDIRFRPLDLELMTLPGTMADVRLKMTDEPLLKTIPFIPPTTANLDLGITAEHAELFEGYTFRSAFDGQKESFLFAVPPEQYIRAWILCALEDNPEKDASLTVRLTRFTSGGSEWGGRGRDSLADTTIQLPRGDEKPPETIRQVGSVSVCDGQVPLWLVELPIKSGEIQDLVFDDKGPKAQGEPVSSNLDFEVLGRLTPLAHPFTDARHFPLATARSGVHVFGITLERPPVEMEVRQNLPGNIFHNDEKPELPVALRVRQSGDYVLGWTIRDAEGKKVGDHSEKISLKAGEGERVVLVSLIQRRLGWYEIVFELRQRQRVLLSHTASFALLGPDTRQAGYESPFSTGQWPWHYSPRDLAITGPLALKAGFRRCGGSAGFATEAECAPWKFTTTCGSLAWPQAMLAKEKSDEDIKKYIADALTRYPHNDHAMIFYESAKRPYEIAPELIGLTQDTKNEQPGADERFEKAMRYARILRESFPQLKILVGNSLGCSELVAELLRRKFPEAYADYVGVETVGRTGQPEKLWAGGFQAGWMLREVARKYGYHKWGVACCPEVNYRHDRLLGQQVQAEWYARDMLLAFAYSSPYINLGGLYDAGNVYNSSFWGAVCFCRRYPLLYPKKSYVAVATLTRILDRVTFIREMPTACNSVYALEFSRPDGRRVYTVWTGRGTAELELIFERGADIELVDLYGRVKKTSTFLKRFHMTAGPAAQYLITDGTVGTLSSGRRTYPEDTPPDNLRIVTAMDRVDDWQLVLGKDPFLEETTWTEKKSTLPYRTAGTFSLRQVKDKEKGECLEVELHPQAGLPDIMSEYAVLRLNEPVTVDGEPTTLGLWVKGNSGWGEVYWEIEDANGIRRLSCGTTDHGGSVFDYDARLATINFEGWNFLRMPITEKSPVPDLSTGSIDNLWEKSKRTAVAYPIKVTGVAVSLPPRALHLTEMKAIRQVIRLKDLSAYK
ncbi:MAG: hypothetical protein WC340_03675 [Kiritimatiellia bacterium]